MGQKWTGCKSRGKPRKVKFKIAFQFELESEDEPSKFSEDYKLDKSYALEYPIWITGYAPKSKPEEPKKEKVFKIVEDMPRFPGCEGQGKSKKELKECSDAEILKFVYSNLKYPKKAIKEKTEGRVVAKFTLFNLDSIGNVVILRDIGNGCGEEVKRVILLMNNMGQKWIPGRSRGPIIKAYFTIPITFKLQSSPRKK